MGFDMTLRVLDCDPLRPSLSHRHDNIVPFTNTEGGTVEDSYPIKSSSIDIGLGIEGAGGAQEEAEHHLQVPLGHRSSSLLPPPPSLSPPIVSHVSPPPLLTDASGNLARHRRS